MRSLVDRRAATRSSSRITCGCSRASASVRSRRDGQMVMYELTDLGARAGRGVPRARGGVGVNPIELPMAPTRPPPSARADRARRDAPLPRRRHGLRRVRARRSRRRSPRSPASTAAAGLVRQRHDAVAGDAPDERDRARRRARRVPRAPGRRGARGADDTPFWRRDARALSTTVVGRVLLVAAVIASLASAPRLVAEPLYLLSMAVGGWPIARAGAGRAAPPARWT